MESARQICIIDNERNASVIGDFLQANGCAVARCTSCGAECRQEGRHPDAILLNGDDLSDGRGALEAIRNREHLFQVPLIVYGARGERARMVKLLQRGATDYLNAPLLKAELLEKIRVHTRTQALLRSFSRFVPEVYLRMMKKKDLANVALGDFAVVPLSVLFTDVRSYTELSEKLAPQDIFRFLNSLFSRMEPVIKRNHGFVDKYIGDAILALFPGPTDDCLDAGLNMMSELRRYNEHRASSGYPPVQMGLGMHQGDVALGTIGSDDRLNATVIGDPVNLASRVETLTKVFGADLILTDSISRQLARPGRYNLREIDTVRVKGKQTPIVLYEAFDINPSELIEKKKMMMGDYERALSLYKQGSFQPAMDLFTACKDFCPEDKIPDIYIRRCNSLIRIPPGKDWAGISTL